MGIAIYSILNALYIVQSKIHVTQITFSLLLCHRNEKTTDMCIKR